MINSLKIFNRNFQFFDKIIGNTKIYTLLLNRPFNNSALCKILPITNTFICADGGANRLRKLWDNKIGHSIPDYLIGDLDSVEKEILTTLSHNKTIIVTDSDQNTSDIEKCLNYIQEMINKGEQHLKHVVLVMGAFGGRLDHTLKNISTLKKYTEINQSLLSNGSYDMLFMDQYSTLLYLPAGENKISLSQSFDSDYGCGVFSFEEKQVEVETTGLEWNIGANYATKYLRFGNEESSSNRTLSKQINVISKNNLYWTNSILIK